MEEFKIKQQERLEKREKNKQHRDEVIKNYRSKQHLKLQNTLSKFREIQIKDRNESKDETQLIAQQRINNWKDHFRLLLKNEKDNEEKRKQNMIELDMIKNKLLEYENKMPKNEIDKIKKDQLNEKSLNASENIKIHQLKSLSINKESEEKNLEDFLKTISKIKDAQSKRQQEIQKKSIFLNQEKRKIKAVKENKKNLTRIYFKKIHSYRTQKRLDESNKKMIIEEGNELSEEDENSKNEFQNNALTSTIPKRRKQIKSIIYHEAQQYNIDRLKRLKSQKNLQVMEKFLRLQQKLEEKKKENEYLNSCKLKHQFDMEYLRKINTQKLVKELKLDKISLENCLKHDISSDHKSEAQIFKSAKIFNSNFAVGKSFTNFIPENKSKVFLTSLN